jgi:hypothetical protein
MLVRPGYVAAVSALVALVLAAAIATWPDRAAADGETIRTETVALGGATAARIDVELGAGTLRLAGGSLAGAGTPMHGGELLRGEFVFANDGLAPRMVYAVEEQRGHLKVEQGGGDAFSWPWDDHHNEWRLFLNPTIPTDLTVEVGAGDSELSLGGLSLTDLEVATGAGETTLDFAGDWRANLNADVETGAGDLTVRLPRQVGVRVEVEQGIGDVVTDGFSEENGVFVNEAYGAAPVTLTLRVDHGAGSITLETVD